jgi:hypothetical protein
MRGLVELPPSYKEPWKGSCTHPRGLGLWQNPDTGEVYIEHMSDKKRFGTSRYGGKLYGMRSQTYFKYHKPAPPDISEVLRPPEEPEEAEVLPELPDVPAEAAGEAAAPPEAGNPPPSAPDSPQESSAEPASTPDPDETTP